MRYTAGIDVGSTYTKAAIVSGDGRLAGTALTETGFRLEEAASRALDGALAQAGIRREELAYIASTGYGRYMVPWRDTQVTDLTAHARGARFFFPGTRTVLDIGGQTMKALRIDDRARVQSFRLNDKCAAGTGAFLEKTARYLGYRIEEIGPLVATSHEAVEISGVCAVFAESEVINQISAGATAADIMHGAMRSLVKRAVQLMRRVQMEPEIALVGGIIRFPTMVAVLRESLGEGLNVAQGPLPQFTGALGAAVLARRRLEKLERQEAAGGVPA